MTCAPCAALDDWADSSIGRRCGSCCSEAEESARLRRQCLLNRKHGGRMRWPGVISSVFEQLARLGAARPSVKPKPKRGESRWHWQCHTK